MGQNHRVGGVTPFEGQFTLFPLVLNLYPLHYQKQDKRSPMIELIDTPLDGLKLIKPRVFGDDRGFFLESFNGRDYSEAGLPTTFLQDNHSRSTRGVLRGLHFQYPSWQGKLVRAVTGEVFDVAVDIRPDSPTRGRWFGTTLSESNHHQLWIPPGFAHGFCVLSEEADFLYKVSGHYYAPADEHCIRWDDPEIGIEWPLDSPLVSEKDGEGAPFSDLTFS